MIRAVLLCVALLGACLGCYAVEPSNFTADFETCRNSAELLKVDHMDLGVRIELATPLISREFQRALRFWQGIVDLDWHLVGDDSCAVAAFKGTHELLGAWLVARSHLPSRPGFKGWIVFDESMPVTMSEAEIYMVTVHEFGHLLGLPHNPDPRSIMYYCDVDVPESLQAEDIAKLSQYHKVRSGLVSPVSVR